MEKPKFCTSIACMDGRIQIPIMTWLKKNHNVDYVDTITKGKKYNKGGISLKGESEYDVEVPQGISKVAYRSKDFTKEQLAKINDYKNKIDNYFNKQDSGIAQFRSDKTNRIIEIIKSDMSSNEKVSALTHEIGHLALHELLEQHKIDLEEYNSKVKELDAKRNKKIDEKGGSWRKEYNNTTDVSRKSDMLRAVAEKSTDKKELTDILDAAKGQVEESNIVADILHKPILKVESANKVLSEDYSPHTKQNVIDWLEHNPEVKKEISKDLIDKAKSEFENREVEKEHPKDTEVGKSLQVMLDAYNKSERGKEDANKLRNGEPLTMEQALKDHETFMQGGETFKMTVNGKEVTVKKLPDDLDIVNGFYSPIEKTVRESKSEKWGSGEQAWNELKGKGLKADEVKWTGIEDWLKQQGKVTKADILDYLKNNRVQLVEVVKGEDMPNYTLTKEPPKELGATRIDLLGDLGRAGNLDNPNFRDYLNKKYGKNGNKIYDWLVENAGVEGTYSKDTKFSQYQQSGDKSNYREILVTMPPAEKLSLKEQQELSELESLRAMDRTHKQNQRMQELYDKIPEGKKTAFKSSHWDEPNIIGHLRISNRIDSEGNKVLHISELQSDWGQKGKKEGFAIPPDKKDYRIEQKDEDGGLRTTIYNKNGDSVHSEWQKYNYPKLLVCYNLNMLIFENLHRCLQYTHLPNSNHHLTFYKKTNMFSDFQIPHCLI